MQGENRNENEVFAAWREADEDDKARILPALVKLLQKHASAVIWNRLGQQRPELVNEAVWKVLDKGDSFRGESMFSTWFHTVVDNLCNQEIKSIIRAKREVSLENVEEQSTDDTTTEEIDTEIFLKGLSKRQKRVLELRLAGLTRQEIAKRMDINEDGVKYILKTLKGRALEVGLGDESKQLSTRV